MRIILDVSYKLKQGFVSCILEKKGKKRKTIISFLFVLTNRILMAEKPSPSINICVLKGKGRSGMRGLPALHGTTRNTHMDMHNVIM